MLSNGEEVPLCPNGANKQVTKENLDEFIKLVLEARFSEAKDQVAALRGGLDIVFEGKINVLSLMNWEQVENRACGEKELDVERLKTITSFPNCSNDHAIVARFWRVFEAFSNEERQQYLKFVWGRTRLPQNLSNLKYKHQVRLMTHMNKTSFPQSHTCFF